MEDKPQVSNTQSIDLVKIIERFYDQKGMQRNKEITYVTHENTGWYQFAGRSYFNFKDALKKYANLESDMSKDLGGHSNSRDQTSTYSVPDGYLLILKTQLWNPYADTNSGCCHPTESVIKIVSFGALTKMLSRSAPYQGLP